LQGESDQSLTAYELTLLGIEKQLSPTRESVAEVSAQLGRFEDRLDRLYWAFIALAVLLIANGIIGNA